MKFFNLFLALTLPVLVGASPILSQDSQGIRKTYFSRGWAETSADLPEPKTQNNPVASGTDSDDDPPIQDLHNPFVHMDITRKAYELYAARYSGGELSRYIA